MNVGRNIQVGALAAGLIAAGTGCSPPPVRSAMVMNSPAGVGVAASVLTHYWDGPIASFYVIDPKGNHGRPTQIAYLREGFDFDRMEWSRDGTIVAVATNSLLAYAYDFNSHLVINAPARLTTVDPHTSAVVYATPAEQDKFIQQALERHGGKGAAAKVSSRRELSRRQSARYGQ